MNKTYLYLLAAIGLSACDWRGTIEETPPRYSEYRPIIMPRDQLEQSVALTPARNINEPGKIYRFGDYVFINERYEGVHIVNNQDPANPQNVGFLRVPGNVDIAAKGNMLYVDNATDLVAVNIADVNAIEVTQRQKNIFPSLMAPDGLQLQEQFAAITLPEDAVIVGYSKISQ